MNKFSLFVTSAKIETNVLITLEGCLCSGILKEELSFVSLQSVSNIWDIYLFSVLLTGLIASWDL